MEVIFVTKPGLGLKTCSDERPFHGLSRLPDGPLNVIEKKKQRIESSKTNFLILIGKQWHLFLEISVQNAQLCMGPLRFLSDES